MALTKVTTGTIADDSIQSLKNRNRIINGDMRIDQRNAGASVTPATGQYSVDRFICLQTASSKYSIQQNAGSVTPPAGFVNYVGVTSLSAYSVAAGDQFYIAQRIEANNLSDLGWGTSNAQSVTLSFWVRSSLTGTFGGSIVNGPTYNYSYPFSYTISSADTWEYKTVTIEGPTSGTWATSGNGMGLQLAFGLGLGPTFSGTAGAWASALHYAPTGATSVVGTSGATFYITGVQLELGDVATPFEHESYGDTLAKCQRYYTEVTSASSGAYIMGPSPGMAWNSTSASGFQIMLPVEMRTAPSFTQSVSTPQLYSPSLGMFNATFALGSASNKALYIITSGSSGLTVNHMYYLWQGSSSVGLLKFDAEL